MRKWCGLMIVGMILLCNQAFGYLEKTLYCEFENKQLTLYVKPEEGMSKCSTYVSTIRSLAFQKYGELQLVYSYMSQGDDAIYRKEVLKQKQKEFLQLISYKAQIEKSISKFEEEIFEMYKSAVEKPLNLYYSDLNVEYYTLINKGNADMHQSDYNERIVNIEQQMWNINHILQSEKLDEIMEVLSSYIYLKKQLEGK